jgi:AcrR family transcriptional regulator
MRARILDAALAILSERGILAVTTKQIAREAGCSEGSLYTYFPNKESLLLAVMTERLPPFIPLLHAMMERAGDGTLREHLEEIARLATAFYRELTPIAACVLVTPELREGLRGKGLGPHRAGQTLAAYLRIEQRVGRIRAGVDLTAVATLLLGACQQRAMNMRFLDQAPDAEADGRFAADIVDALMHGLSPAHDQEATSG